jgi:CheY-like chemotaxis protein
MVMDGSGCVREISGTLARLLSQEGRSVLGASFLHLVHRHDVRNAVTFLSEAIEQVAEPVRGEVRVLGADGNWHALELVASADPDDTSADASTIRVSAYELSAEPGTSAPEPLHTQRIEILGTPPAHPKHASPFDPTTSPTPPTAQGETVLVVVDERPVSVLTVSILEDLGYTVLEASSPADAEGFARVHRGEIHLVIADLATPRVRGREFLRVLHAIRPGLRSLYLSSQRYGSLAERRVYESGARLLHEPFTAEELAHAVRRSLDDVDVPTARSARFFM